MDILLSSDMPVKVLADLRNLGIDAEIDTGAPLEKTVQRAQQKNTVLMVPIHAAEFQTELLQRAPGVIALGKKAFSRRGLAGSVTSILQGFHPEQYLNHVSILHGSGPSQAVFRLYENQPMQEGITIPRGSNEQFLHFGTVGREELHQAGIRLAGFTRTQRGYFVERRTANFHILGMVLQGVLEVHPEGEKPVLHRSGSSFFIPVGFRGFYRATRPTEFLWFHVEPCVLGLRSGLSYRWNQGTCCPSLTLAARQFLEESRSSESDRSLVLTRLAQLLELLLHRLVRGFGIDPVAETGRERLRHALRKVEMQISKNWTVPALAQAAGLSVSKLYREARLHHGKRPGALIEELRIRHASELLTHFDHKLQELANMIGYADPFSFSRAFKRVMGTSPSEYRQRAHSKKVPAG